MTYSIQKFLKLVSGVAVRLAALALPTIGFGVGAAQAQINLYVTNENNNTVSVISTETNTISATIPVGSTPDGIAITPNRAFLYVVDLGANSVSVVSTATNTVTATVPVGTLPFKVAINPNGAFAYVTNVVDGTVSVIDTATNTVTATVPVGKDPIGVAVTPNGNFVYVTNEGSNSVSVIATATNTVVATVPVGAVPDTVAISPDGTVAYVGDDISLGPPVGGITVISTATNTVTATVATSNQPDGIAFTANGAFAYIANFVGSSVSVINTATVTVVATITSASAETPTGVAINPSGAFAYAPNFNSNNLSVINTSTNTITTLVAGLDGPGDICITPDTAPVALCQNVTVNGNASCTANASINNGSFDPDGDPITLIQSPAGPYPVGTTTVTLTATDSFGLSSQCTSTVTVVNTVPPTITLKPSIEFWPPDGRYVTVTTAEMVASVTGGCGTTTGSVVILQVTSNDGLPAFHDIIIAPDCTSVQLRKIVDLFDLLSGGRVYTITLQVTDSEDNSATAKFVVTVPILPFEHLEDHRVAYTVLSDCHAAPVVTHDSRKKHGHSR
jgi:YVTN family beta-propeller protein